MAYTNFNTNNESLLKTLVDQVKQKNSIDPELYVKYEVKKGLRDINGKGVLAGLTEIGDVRSYIIEDGEMVPIPGKLFYRGIDIKDIVTGFLSENRFGFEETIYLLLFGNLPTKEALKDFNEILSAQRNLPDDFVRDIIMKAPSADMMNSLSRSVLTLYSFDSNPDNSSIENVLLQCLKLISILPLITVYGYQTYAHYFQNSSLVIHSPRPELSTAENILHMLKPDSTYTELEAKLLDLALVLHAEHGGGNNSTFVTHVVTSSGTDTYSSVAAALGSLKGPKHGGANIKVIQMFEDIKQNVHNWNDDDEILSYLEKLLNKSAFDKSGLIYGIGHAVYSISDPRSEILKEQAIKLAESKGMLDEINLYLKVEDLAPKAIASQRKIYKGVSANVDFYSGIVYQMLDIPPELFTPIFAVSRIVGWSAHIIEEIVNNGKIIRPAYKSIAKKQAYTNMEDRS